MNPSTAIRRLFLGSCLVLLTLMSPSLWAQGVGSILGTVTDDAGAVIPGVEVTLLNELTGLGRSTVSSDVGYYEFRLLPIGVYTVRAELSGFQASQSTGVELETDRQARVDIQLQVGEITETVTVEGEPPLIETETATVGEVVTGRQIMDLPLDNRQWLRLATLTTGATPAARDFRSREAGGRGVTMPSVSGGRPEDNNYQLDGVDNREIGRANFAISPSIEGIAEFKVRTGVVSAEHGRVASASIDVVTKSGTNEIHGSVFEFLRNDVFDARNFFARDVSPLKRNQFGGAIGGPIIKNKHFFFGTFEAFLQDISGNPRVGVVPTPDMRQGVFSSQIRDTINDNQPFPNNTIPRDRIDPISARVMEFIPLPNSSDPVRNFNYIRDPTEENKYLATIRTDHNLGDDDQLFVRYSLDDEEIISASSLPTSVGGVVTTVKSQGIAVQETHTFSPQVINEALFGWTRFDHTRLDEHALREENIAQQLGVELVGLDGDAQGFGFPSISIRGFLAPTGTIPRPRSTDIIHLRNTTSITRNNHTVRLGGEFRAYDSDNFSPGQLNGSFTFQGSFTGNSFADFLLGWPLRAFRNIGPAAQNASMQYYAAFLQDDWKVTDRLTLNLGLRYELETAMSEDENELALFDLNTDTVMFPEDTRGVVEAFYREVLPDIPIGFFSGGLYRADKNNFSPRIGFAWRPFGHTSTVIRGGGGIYYTAPQMTTLLASVSAPPFSRRPQLVSDSAYPELRWNPAGGLDQAIKGPFTCFCMVTHDLPYAYMEQWALTVQQKLTSDMALELGYVGSHTLDLFSFMQRNLAPPGPGSPILRAPHGRHWARIQSSEHGFTSRYNGLTMKLEKRAAAGLSFLAAYTVSKAIDQASTWNAVSISRHDNRRELETGRADFDTLNRFSFAYSYELPFGPGRALWGDATGFAARLVEGWGIRGITTFMSGFPFFVRMSGGVTNMGAGAAPRPYRRADGNLPESQRNINRWFDTAAFEIPPRYTLGDSGRNILVGPGFSNFDLSVVKRTQITETQRFEFRAEFFNAFNHPNFGFPANNVSTARTFGFISGAGNPRIIQLGFKYYY